MKIRQPHIPYVARKIAIDMLKSGFITFKQDRNAVVSIAEEILKEDAMKERAIDEKVNELLDENSDDMHIMQVDKRSMFWMVKKRLAEEQGFILNHEDRYSHLSHHILEMAWKKDLIEYNVSENRARNVIYSSINEYGKIFEDVEEIVATKLENGKRKLIPGTEEYDLEFERYYQDELKKRGMF